MSTATSSSERYAEAREALQWFQRLSEWSAPEQWAESTHYLAEALRSVIEPAAVDEQVDYIVARLVVSEHRRDGEWFPRNWDDVQRLLTRAVHEGIQAAWNSWEPDDYAPTLCDKCGGDL